LIFSYNLDSYLKKGFTLEENVPLDILLELASRLYSP